MCANPLKPYRKRNARLRNNNIAATYKDYLQSPEWKAIRQQVLDRDKHTCQCCLKPATEVHHTKYNKATLTGRLLNSMFAICRRCHQWIEFDKDGNKLHLGEVRKRVFILKHLNKVPK